MVIIWLPPKEIAGVLFEEDFGVAVAKLIWGDPVIVRAYCMDWPEFHFPSLKYSRMALPR